jgi:hypothetical protein
MAFFQRSNLLLPDVDLPGANANVGLPLIEPGHANQVNPNPPRYAQAMGMPIPNNDAPFVPRMQEILVDMLKEALHFSAVLERQYEETRREQALSNRATIERHQQLLHMLNLRPLNVNPPAQEQLERAFRPEGNINANLGKGGHGIEANRRQVNHVIPARVPLRRYAPQNCKSTTAKRSC